MYKGLKGRLQAMIPLYAILPLLSCLGLNCVIYFGTSQITANWKHYDWTTSFDRAVPLIPEFMIIYFGCYLFWAFNYILIARQGKEYCMRFVLADMMSRVLCGVFFLLTPTTNIRPEILGDGIWEDVLRILYQIDDATNLFPSIHCLVSWFCYIGIRGRKNIPIWYRIFSCCFALLVFVSTQVTKQHYIVDVFGGIFIAEITFYIGFHTNWYKGIQKIFDRISANLLERGNLLKGKENN